MNCVVVGVSFRFTSTLVILLCIVRSLSQRLPFIHFLHSVQQGQMSLRGWDRLLMSPRAPTPTSRSRVASRRPPPHSSTTYNSLLASSIPPRASFQSGGTEPAVDKNPAARWEKQEGVRSLSRTRPPCRRVEQSVASLSRPVRFHRLRHVVCNCRGCVVVHHPSTISKLV